MSRDRNCWQKHKVHSVDGGSCVRGLMMGDPQEAVVEDDTFFSIFSPAHRASQRHSQRMVSVSHYISFLLGRVALSTTKSLDWSSRQLRECMQFQKTVGRRKSIHLLV